MLLADGNCVPGADRDEVREYLWGDAAVSELAAVVRAPAPQRAVVTNPTVVAGACDEGLPIRSRANGCQAVRRGAVAQFAVAVVTPAPQRVRGLNPARVAATRTDRAPAVAVPLWTGLFRGVVVPSPSSPCAFEPSTKGCRPS